jgi:hypothetical protein
MPPAQPQPRAAPPPKLKAPNEKPKDDKPQK